MAEAEVKTQELDRDTPPITNKEGVKSNTESEKTAENKDKITDGNLNRKRKHQDDADLIAEHYNKIQAVKPEDRGQSRIINLRNFNNWLKGVLITEFCGRARATTVLDLACGKGGDLPKWKRTPIKNLVGIDIAALSIKEARSRYEQMSPKFDASYHVLDAFHKDWSEAIPDGQTFDVISCQFAYHYSFETEESAKHSLAMVAKYLRSGGYFFGTIPNFRAIRELLAGGQSMHNDICSLRLDEGISLDEPGYGKRYHFDLAEAIDSCPEYFIPMPLLEDLAEEQGLSLYMSMPFPEFFEQHVTISAYRESLRRMGVVAGPDDQLQLSPEEVGVAELYLAFCFRKKQPV